MDEYLESHLRSQVTDLTTENKRLRSALETLQSNVHLMMEHTPDDRVAKSYLLAMIARALKGE